MCPRTQELQQRIGFDTRPSGFILEQLDDVGPLVWWGKYNSRFFLLPSSLLAIVDRPLPMPWLNNQGSTRAVSVRTQGREELMLRKTSIGGARLPGPLVTLHKTAYGDLFVKTTLERCGPFSLVVLSQRRSQVTSLSGHSDQNASETFSNKLQLNKVQSSLRQTSAKTTQVRSKAKTS